jgi:hypothetical protein
MATENCISLLIAVRTIFVWLPSVHFALSLLAKSTVLHSLHSGDVVLHFQPGVGWL